mmetsp:Transcript_79564/g.257264  ORF Transcript_79564/g.257264 Transcript_79564/m.257264 type:complete len:345 (+) Transcript_79564:118-1152(+)
MVAPGAGATRARRSERTRAVEDNKVLRLAEPSYFDAHTSGHLCTFGGGQGNNLLLPSLPPIARRSGPQTDCRPCWSGGISGFQRVRRQAARRASPRLHLCKGHSSLHAGTALAEIEAASTAAEHGTTNVHFLSAAIAKKLVGRCLELLQPMIRRTSSNCCLRNCPLLLLAVIALAGDPSCNPRHHVNAGSEHCTVGQLQVNILLLDLDRCCLRNRYSRGIRLLDLHLCHLGPLLPRLLRHLQHPRGSPPDRSDGAAALAGGPRRERAVGRWRGEGALGVGLRLGILRRLARLRLRLERSRGGGRHRRAPRSLFWRQRARRRNMLRHRGGGGRLAAFGHRAQQGL